MYGIVVVFEDCQVVDLKISFVWVCFVCVGQRELEVGAHMFVSFSLSLSLSHEVVECIDSFRDYDKCCCRVVACMGRSWPLTLEAEV